MRLLVGYPRTDYEPLHAALAARGHTIAAVEASLPALLEAAARLPCDLALLWASLAESPGALQAALERLARRAPVAVVVPPELARAEGQIRAMGDPKGRLAAAVGTAKYDEWDRVAALVAEAAATVLAARAGTDPAPAQDDSAPPAPDPVQPVEPAPAPPASRVNAPPPEPAPISTPYPGRGEVLAVWSGSCGGTGKSTLAAEIAGLAASRGVTVLVGLHEPGGLVAGLDARSRPDLLDLANGESGVQRRGALALVPGPSDPARMETLCAHPDALRVALRALCAGHALAVLDLPPALSGPGVDTALGIADRVLYVLRPAVADGIVAARALALLARRQKPVVAAWNPVGVGGNGVVGPEGVRAAVEEVGVAFPEVVGTVPFHPGVLAARDRRQLLFEAAQDGVVAATPAAAVAALAATLFGWAAPEGAFRLPGLRVRVVE